VRAYVLVLSMVFMSLQNVWAAPEDALLLSKDMSLNCEYKKSFVMFSATFGRGYSLRGKDPTLVTFTKTEEGAVVGHFKGLKSHDGYSFDQGAVGGTEDQTFPVAVEYVDYRPVYKIDFGQVRVELKRTGKTEFKGLLRDNGLSLGSSELGPCVLSPVETPSDQQPAP
jgi:hypothetical protein